MIFLCLAYLLVCSYTFIGKVSVTLSRVFPHPSQVPTNHTSSTHDIPLAYLNIHIYINKVKKVSGDASTLFNRGKKKYIYDYNAECDWKLEATVHPSNSFSDSIITAHGTITLNDITTGDEDCEMTVEVGGNKNNSNGTITNQEVQGLITKHVKSSAHKNNNSNLIENLQTAIKETLKRFDADFKAAK